MNNERYFGFHTNMEKQGFLEILKDVYFKVGCGGYKKDYAAALSKINDIIPAEVISLIVPLEPLIDKEDVSKVLVSNNCPDPRPDSVRAESYPALIIR